MTIDGGLRALFGEHLKMVHWQAIETGGTGLGVPDHNGCYGGQEWWNEYKKTDGWAVTMRPQQIGWHLRRARAGGRTFIAIRRRTRGGPRTAPADELWMFRGEFARQLKEGGLRCGIEPLLCETGGPARWTWERILLVMCKPHWSGGGDEDD